MTAQEIVKSLRCCATHSGCDTGCTYWPDKKCENEMMAEAADLIETQAADNQRKDEQIATLTAELAQVKRERDAAVKDLKTAKRCKVCKHNHIKEMDEPCFSCSCCCGVNNFEWRGVTVEGETQDV